MKHLLDYELLKEWGFEWAVKREYAGEELVDSYIMLSSIHTDMFGFMPISLSFYQHENVNVIWVLSVVGAKDGGGTKVDTLFKGKINNREDLLKILELCLVFKPKPAKIANRFFQNQIAIDKEILKGKS